MLKSRGVIDQHLSFWPFPDPSDSLETYTNEAHVIEERELEDLIQNSDLIQVRHDHAHPGFVSNLPFIPGRKHSRPGCGGHVPAGEGIGACGTAAARGRAGQSDRVARH